MSTPTDIIANAIRATKANRITGADRLAWAAIEALTHDDIVANGARALTTAGLIDTLSDGTRAIVATPEDIARIVLDSVRSE